MERKIDRQMKWSMCKVEVYASDREKNPETFSQAQI